MDRLRSLRLFVQVVKARNFTAASNQLNISRSYLSREISALETALGVRLINRTTRHVSPTEIGRVYYERCAKILDDLDEADFELAANHGEPRGHIRLLAPKSFMVFALPDAIASFSKKYPGVEMTILPFDRKIDLIQSGIDLALRFGDLSDSTLVCRKLAAFNLQLCATPRYLEQHGLPKTPQDLLDHNCLRHTIHTHNAGWIFQSPDGPLEVKVSGSLVASSSMFLRECILRDLGIGVVPRYSVAADIRQGRLLNILEDFPLGPQPLYGMYAGNHLSHRVRLFMDHLASWFGAERPDI